MRTFECLAAEKKILTSNENIRKESFYNHNLIRILSENFTKNEINFIKAQATEKYTDKSSYSIDSWIDKIFNASGL
jgi:hypothetical protein